MKGEASHPAGLPAPIVLSGPAGYNGAWQQRRRAAAGAREEGELKYVHHPLNEEIRAIGGYYKVLEEGVLEFEGRKVFYVLKGAHVETSCCGSGGMGLISVPGYIVSWKSGKNDDGLAVSELKRIVDSEPRKKIKALLSRKYPYISVVDFE